MIIMPGDAVTCAMMVAADIASTVADFPIAITGAAVSSVAIEASDATTAWSRPPTHAGTRVRRISVRMFEWPPLLAPPCSHGAAVI